MKFGASAGRQQEVWMEMIEKRVGTLLILKCVF